MGFVNSLDARVAKHLSGPSRATIITTAGYGLLGASSLVLLASGPRLMGATAYSSLAVLWTTATLFGIGVTQPGEQAITRSVASGSAGVLSDKRITSVLSLLGIAVVGGVAMFRDVLYPGNPLLYLAATALAVSAWVFTARLRGAAAGRKDFLAYAASLSIEACTRVVLVIAAWLMPEAIRPALLALAVGLPVLVSAIPVLRPRRSMPAPETLHFRKEHKSLFHGLIAFVLVGVLWQIVVISGPIWLQLRSNGPLAGEAANTLAYFRMPVVLVGGLAVVTLSHASTAWATGNIAVLRKMIRLLGLRTWAVGAAASAILLAFSPTLLPVVYPETHSTLPFIALAAVAFASALMLPVGVINQALFGMRMDIQLITVGCVATTASVLSYLLVDDPSIAVSIGLLTGLVLWGVGQMITLIRAQTPAPSE